MIFIIAQIIGFIAFFFSLLAYHKNKKEKILGNMIISNSLNLIHYVLLGALSGGATKVIAILRDIIIILKKKYKILSSNLILIIFVLFYIIIGIVFYSSIWSILPILSALIYTIPLWNGNELIVKKAAYLSRILWLIYNIIVLSISGIVADTVFIISTFIAYENTKNDSMKTIKIGYQGIKGSNSEKVALKFKNKFNNAKLIGLTTSKNVVNELKNNNIDYGVLALKNSIAGDVLETTNALKNIKYEVTQTISLNIHHCAFKLKGISNKRIKYVASHIQALNQTNKFIKERFNNLKIIEVEDTALSAFKLVNKELPPETVIICNKKVGDLYNLELVAENIEDKSDNKTEFIVIKKL